MDMWIKRHHEANTALEDREEKLDELYEETEKDMLVSTPDQHTHRRCVMSGTLPKYNKIVKTEW